MGRSLFVAYLLQLASVSVADATPVNRGIYCDQIPARWQRLIQFFTVRASEPRAGAGAIWIEEADGHIEKLHVGYDMTNSRWNRERGRCAFALRHSISLSELRDYYPIQESGAHKIVSLRGQNLTTRGGTLALRLLTEGFENAREDRHENLEVVIQDRTAGSSFSATRLDRPFDTMAFTEYFKTFYLVHTVAAGIQRVRFLLGSAPLPRSTDFVRR